MKKSRMKKNYTQKDRNEDGSYWKLMSGKKLRTGMQETERKAKERKDRQETREGVEK